MTSHNRHARISRTGPTKNVAECARSCCFAFTTNVTAPTPGPMHDLNKFTIVLLYCLLLLRVLRIYCAYAS